MNSSVLVVGAGAAGLMAGHELVNAGCKVTILEARERIGGRIQPLTESEFGFVVQGGAEFVHGKAPVTKLLAEGAGMTLLPMEGEAWTLHGEELIEDATKIPNRELIDEKLRSLKSDLPIAEFLAQFDGPEFTELKETVMRMVQGYDAADPTRMSTFSLRDEWLGNDEWEQYRIKEGYGALLQYLENELLSKGAEIRLNTMVTRIDATGSRIKVTDNDSNVYEADKVIVSVPLPLISRITFIPELPNKLSAADDVGFGGVIKILCLFSERWWEHARGKDLSKMVFIHSREIVPTWWSRYPDSEPLMTGWLAGPITEKFKKSSSEEIIDMALQSLSNIFLISKDELKNMLVKYRVMNWTADPLALGGYSYTTVAAAEARKELARPENDKIFFTGEALSLGEDSSTVEGALANGKRTAEIILQEV